MKRRGLAKKNAVTRRKAHKPHVQQERKVELLPVEEVPYVETVEPTQEVHLSYRDRRVPKSRKQPISKSLMRQVERLSKRPPQEQPKPKEPEVVDPWAPEVHTKEDTALDANPFVRPSMPFTPHRPEPERYMAQRKEASELLREVTGIVLPHSNLISVADGAASFNPSKTELVDALAQREMLEKPKPQPVQEEEEAPEPDGPGIRHSEFRELEEQKVSPRVTRRVPLKKRKRRALANMERGNHLARLARQIHDATWVRESNKGLQTYKRRAEAAERKERMRQLAKARKYHMMQNPVARSALEDAPSMRRVPVMGTPLKDIMVGLERTGLYTAVAPREDDWRKLPLYKYRPSRASKL